MDVGWWGNENNKFYVHGKINAINYYMVLTKYTEIAISQMLQGNIQKINNWQQQQQHVQHNTEDNE